MTERPIDKICPAGDRRRARAAGRYDGSPHDAADGFIHFSTAAQLAGTLAKHYAGQDGLVLLTVDAAALDAAALRWEPARGGALFPHLYAPLPAAAVVAEHPLPLGPDGRHVLPAIEGA